MSTGVKFASDIQLENYLFFFKYLFFCKIVFRNNVSEKFQCKNKENQQLLIAYFACFLILKIEAVRNFETSVSWCQSAWGNSPDVCIFQV